MGYTRGFQAGLRNKGRHWRAYVIRITNCLALSALLWLSMLSQSSAQGIGINETGAAPDSKAILDIASSSKGLLIPRMSSAERDAIAQPPLGLQLYNTTSNTLDIYRGSGWESLSFSESAGNMVRVSSLADLPAPQGDAITLDPSKVYVFSGIVDLGGKYLDLNGAAIKGEFPEKDGVTSAVAGAIVRSTDQNVYIEKIAIVLPAGATTALDLRDATGEKLCTIFPGTNIVEAAGASLGVGTVSGFKYVSVVNNYWRCADGMKVGGTMGEFTMIHSIITGVTTGSGVEFLPGLTVDAIDLSNNYFTYTGQVGVKSGPITFNNARMVTNMFTSVATPTEGFDHSTPGWEMKLNAGVADSRVYGSLHMNDNALMTSVVQNEYRKIAGTTTSVKLERFTAPDNNRLQYIGRYPISGKIFVGVAGEGPAGSSNDVKVVIAKNGTVIPSPAASIRNLSSQQSFQLSFVSEVDLVTGDYLEVFVRTNFTNSLLISDMQIRVTD